MTTAERSLPVGTWLRMYLRLFAVQGAWNYETMLGNGIAFCTEPALRMLPGGLDGKQYAEALGRKVKRDTARQMGARLLKRPLISAYLLARRLAQMAAADRLGATSDRVTEEIASLPSAGSMTTTGIRRPGT